MKKVKKLALKKTAIASINNINRLRGGTGYPGEEFTIVPISTDTCVSFLNVCPPPAPDHDHGDSTGRPCITTDGQTQTCF